MYHNVMVLESSKEHNNSGSLLSKEHNTTGSLLSTDLCIVVLLYHGGRRMEVVEVKRDDTTAKTVQSTAVLVVVDKVLEIQETHLGRY